MTSHDAGLVREARLGSREAVGDLFEEHWRSAWKLAYGLMGERTAADDVAQAAFERAIRALPSFNGASSFGTWLARIVINVALNERRRQRRFQPGEIQADTVEPERPDPALLAAVAALPSDRRVALVLRYWLDWTPAEIAEALGVPAGTVHSRLARALAELRSRLEVNDVVGH